MKVLISGAGGQDGLNMIDYLLKNTNNEIIATSRNMNSNIFSDYFSNKKFLFLQMDIIDEISVKEIFKKVMPDYFINFAAKSSVANSWKHPKLTFLTNSLSIITILELIKDLKSSCKFYSAGSSEEFGDIETTPQTLSHPLKPRSPYGASKCAARHIVKVYRESYNLFAIHCVLFNHESPRRNKHYVTRKITSNLARIKHELEQKGKITPFELGNINTRRDWSDSEDFMEAIWLMLNQDKPDEYILSSNKDYSVKDFINLACKHLELNYKWVVNSNPIKTKLYINNQMAISISEDFYRPAEINVMRGDCMETYKKLNWSPKTNFNQLVKKMCYYDYNLLKK